METLQEQVETLTKLFAALEIPTEVKDEEINMDTENDIDVVYDFTTDEEENPYSNPYTNFGIKRDKSYVEDDYQNQYIYGPPSLEENYLYRQGMVKNKQNKWEKVPPQYIPKLFVPQTSSDVLSIDCDTKPEKTIQEWSNKMGIQIQLTEELKNLQPRDFLNYITHKTQGNAYRFLSSLKEEDKMMIATTDAIETFKNVLNKLIEEFIGKQASDYESQEAFQQQTLWHLTNLRICNMCYLESFICEYSEHYYQLDSTKQKTALEMFYQKLPPSVSQNVIKEFDEIVQLNRISDTLGARISILKAWLQRNCLEQKTKQEAKINLCCENFSSRVGQYGCKTNKRKFKKKKVWKKQTYKPKYKQFYKQGNRKYFRNRQQYNRKYKSKPTSQYCPSNKKNCKCWICQEEGHKAFECPKKYKNEKETNLLKIAYDFGYDPIEDSDIDSDIEIYAYTTDSSDSE